MPTAAILVPCVLGIVGMINDGIPVRIWMQNPIYIAVFAFAACMGMRMNVRIPAGAVVAISALLIALTFLGPDIDGVHRWLNLPGFTLNAGAAVLPASVVALRRLADERRTVWCLCGTASIAGMLCMQPDASQLLAFALPVLVLLIGGEFHRAVKWSGAGVLVLLTLLSWLHLDTLVPASHTEGILTLLRKQSVLLYLAGILSLLLVPAGLVIRGIRENRKCWTDIGLYYAMMSIAAFSGRFPVPFMGYGASPILGYSIMIWLCHTEDLSL